MWRVCYRCADSQCLILDAIVMRYVRRLFGIESYKYAPDDLDLQHFSTSGLAALCSDQRSVSALTTRLKLPLEENR